MSICSSAVHRAVCYKCTFSAAGMRVKKNNEKIKTSAVSKREKMERKRDKIIQVFLWRISPGSCEMQKSSITVCPVLRTEILNHPAARAQNVNLGVFCFPAATIKYRMPSKYTKCKWEFILHSDYSSQCMFSLIHCTQRSQDLSYWFPLLYMCFSKISAVILMLPDLLASSPLRKVAYCKQRSSIFPEAISA